MFIDNIQKHQEDQRTYTTTKEHWKVYGKYDDL